LNYLILTAEALQTCGRDAGLFIFHRFSLKINFSNFSCSRCVISFTNSSKREIKLMPLPRIAPDPRWFQIGFQALFLFYGIAILHWPADWQHYFISITGCLLFQYNADSLIAKRFLTNGALVF
jgi:hypothetical protein